ncbi:hybrid sensor histidine kinase/response regulator [Parasedimentitalea huanghaiensis]|uniref:histidine kinase n=1 Tax=Parasedimentitalea huanghaiensis TaxID=2682100 RepID=A0A6L6WL47_9RHOB|nr:ATP-binding protein [Zongyanglinia huanghaiensis]MVO18414.1 PAS domain S-box protein [Zongyanglinia huanghaiensis]
MDTSTFSERLLWPRLIAAAALILLVVTVSLGVVLGVKTRQQFREIDSSWEAYSGGAEHKGILISSLREHLGFGGIIHNFKNYVLRRDPAYLTETRVQISQTIAVVEEFKQLELSNQERAALATVLGTIRLYQSRLDMVETAIAEGASVEHIDGLVRVDDTAAIGALLTLEQIWNDIQAVSSRRIVSAVDQGQQLILIGFMSVAALSLAALIIAGMIYFLVQHLRGAVSELALELTKRRRLQRSEARLAAAVEQSPATIAITGTDARIQYVNKKFEALSGWSRDEVIGETPSFLQSGRTSNETYTLLRQKLMDGQSWTGVFLNRKKDGSEYWVETTILPLIADNGSIQNFIAVGEDITEKRHARDQVVRAQKLEAVGQLSGGIAHDFNNILTTIIGASHLASLDADEGSDLAGEIEQIDIAAHRAQDLVRELLSFARREPGQPQPVDLSEITDEVTRLLRASMPPTVQSNCDSSGPMVVLGDPTHLHQIVMNLCKNAGEAIGSDEGLISVGFAPVKPPQGLIQRADGWVLLTVRDNGPGMSEDTRTRLFEPFFTTKPMGKGAGLGLAVVYGLVEEMGGLITVDSALGEGTCFSIYLPASSEQALSEGRQRQDMPRGTETIMLVDDDIEISGTFRRLLLRLGYRVEAFTSSVVALERFRKQPDRFDIILSDLMMPELSGEGLITAIRELRPEIPVLFCSGYKPDSIVVPGEQPVVLDKPVDPVDLANGLRQQLENRQTK